MANPHLAKKLATFEATVQRTKNRLVAVPREVQRQLGLIRQPDNYILHYSIRPKGRGPWYPHLSYLTRDNEFAVPADATKIQPGDPVEVTVHRVVANVDAPGGQSSAEETDPVLRVAAELEAAGVSDPRTDGSIRHDDYLNEEIRSGYTGIR